jgi:large subunit ribosomal protein L24
MKIKKGDKVKVTTGKYRPTEGAVLEVRTKQDRVVVEGVNVKKRAVKKTDSNNENYIYIQHSIHVSNVKLIAEGKSEPKSEIKKASTKDAKKTTKKSKTVAK